MSSETLNTAGAFSQAKDLKNRLVNSIRGKDVKKFSRGITKIIKEAQREQENADK